MKNLKSSKILVFGTISFILLLGLMSNTYAIGEQGSSCGTLAGCMNFTMWPGSVKTLPWTLINSANSSVNFYIVSPYYGNSSKVPLITYEVNCSNGQSSEVVVYNSTTGNSSTELQANYCLIPPESNFTVQVTVNVSKQVPLNETWGDCTQCLSVAYPIQTQNVGGATIALPTAKRILVSVKPKPIITTTVRQIIAGTCSGICKSNTTNQSSNNTSTNVVVKDPVSQNASTDYTAYLIPIGVVTVIVIVVSTSVVLSRRKRENYNINLNDKNDTT